MVLLELPLPPEPDPPDLLADFLELLFDDEPPEADFEVDGVSTIGAGVELDDVDEELPPPLAAPDEPPERPAPEVAPPTIPTKASTWHLMVVFAALSTVPFSTTTTDKGASRTATVSKTLGGVSQSRFGE